MTRQTKSGVFQRRAIIPCLILSCIILYALFFISYLVHSGNEPAELRSANDRDIKQYILYKSASPPLPTTPIACNILVAHGGDDGAGFATLIYAYPINFILYAQKYNYTLYLDYHPSYNDLYYEESYGANTFEYYFEPIEPDWTLCDKNKSAYRVLKPKEIKVGIHKRERGSIHLWYYHFKVQQIEYNPDEYLNEWYYQQRSTGYAIVQKHFRLKREIAEQRDAIWTAAFGDDESLEILGIQMRGSDKVQRWSIRRKVEPEEYMPYIASFVEYYGEKARVFFATDDKNYFKYLSEHWSQFVNEKYRFDAVVVTQGNVTRSGSKTAVFQFKHVSKYAIGREVLLDILLLAKCDWFIHSASAVSEAVFFNNLRLHNQSVHLEYTINRQQPFWFSSKTSS